MGNMGVTNLPGELETKANGRRGQRAGMLSRSWLRLVLITALNIATGPRVRQLASSPSGAVGLILSHESVPGPTRKFRDVRFHAAVGGTADIDAP